MPSPLPPTTPGWTLHPATRKSWMREILALLAVLVAANILVNAWQSWHDFRAVSRSAAWRFTARKS